MCGICGMVGPDPVDPDVLARMTATLRHRGPDDEGAFIASYDSVAVGLGFRRLSIIDLESGNQPISNEDGSVQLVLNGEIYNFRELRRDLEARGHRFTSHVDVEVLVHLYEEHGARCVDHIDGMFAFALWDAKRQEMLLGRDRFGKKPLYWAEAGGGLVFGSELKALMRHPLCRRELDRESLSRYLAAEYVPTPRSIIAGVRKLPGGCVLRWARGRISTERYWDLSFQAGEARPDQEYVDEFGERLRAAVSRRLVSDVPLGAFLSGGIDSSSVVAMMVDVLGPDAVKTFSIGFGESSFDESGHARRVAEHLGTEHHEETFTARTMLDLLPTVAGFLDEPFADASILPTYLLSRFARESVTVALGGDGGDELLAGYPTFPADRVASRLPLSRGIASRVLTPLADRLPVSTANFSVDFKVKRFLRGAGLPDDARHAAWLGSFSESEQVALLGTVAGDPLAETRETFARAPTTDPVHRLVYMYARTYLQDDILVKVDRASMACSLEVRSPFLDTGLADFLGTVPSRLKLRRLGTKHILKRALSPMLPDGIAKRPKKGFGVPVAEWLKNELREPLLEELAPERLRAQGIFAPGEVQRLVNEHMSGRRDHRKPLWTLFMFQLWHREWMR